MKKVLFGGSFNPPTIAHYEIINYLATSQLYDEILILPNGDTYEFGGKSLNNFDHRVKMLHLMCNHLPNVKILEIENQEEFLGTAHTLKLLNHPTFVIGADCLDHLHLWKNFETLINENQFLVFARSSLQDVHRIILNNPNLKAYDQHFTIVDLKTSDVSSSEFRLTKNEKMVKDEVLEYIKSNHLYGF